MVEEKGRWGSQKREQRRNEKLLQREKVNKDSKAGMRWAEGKTITERISKKEKEETQGKKGKGRRNVRTDYRGPSLTSSF